ncbi:trichoplein keratin filament-binding protein [Coregonus clupeaformis]|uniref:trichoplein keratin filament-binding protein n=1 Tax=Coregonus clupeaformis TaxID=59861 RepID=UPI001BE00401|nr:trichoplein keratin filament-binding protein [Coregonus clupeaformis]XP_041756403.1 trichoplein keratin filament-binding protein [Coregonus clupeaformis]
MALPTLSAHWPSRVRSLESQMVRHCRQREQEARWRQQWEMHSKYYRQQNVVSSKQAHWSSRQSYQQSMSAYHKERLKEEQVVSLEQRRERLRTLLQEERDQLEAELRDVVPDRSTLTRQLVDKTEDLRSAREERRKKLAEELLKEHWKKNNPELRKVESTLHKDHVVSQWQTQTLEKKQHEEAAEEEKRRFENEYERSRREALGRMKQAEERRRAEDRERAEELRKQMEELKLREEEARHLKKEQEALLSQRWEVEKLEEERRKVEECHKKSEMGRFLTRQYRAQLKRRAQQVQEELEADRRILAALLEGEQEDQRLESVRRERAVADAAWMKHVIEEQLQLEREREAEFDVLYREEAQRVWEKREAEWEKERRARERLMQEVLAGRQQQLEVKMQENLQAQEESLRRREELIEELELERQTRRQEREEDEGHRTARMQEINAQVEQRRREQWEEQRRREQMEEEEREALRLQEEELRLETHRMVQQGYQDKIRSRPRSAWT